MEVINVIAFNRETILSVDTFGVLNDEAKDEVSQEAEDFFIQRCKEIKFGVGFKDTEETDDFGDDCGKYLEDGQVEIYLDEISESVYVSIVWSTIDNVQI